MHDSHAKTEARVRTALEMRLRPRGVGQPRAL